VKYLAITLLFLASFCLISRSSLGLNDILSEITSKHGAKIHADQISLNQITGDISAHGNVTIEYTHYTINAVNVLYNAKENIVTAHDNVLVRDHNTTNVYTAQRARILPDSAQLSFVDAKIGALSTSADTVNVLGKGHLLLHSATISLCKICGENWIPDTPLWRFRAKEIDMNLEKSTFEYKNAYLDLWNKPILYFPYFQTPSFDVKQKTGFLFPQVYIGNNYGASITTPYYFSMSPTLDFFITPHFSTSRPMMFEAEMRQIIGKGSYTLGGILMKEYRVEDSTENASERDIRGYVYGSGKWIVDSSTNAGFKLDRLFDPEKTFLRIYQIKEDDILISNVYLNHYEKNLQTSVHLDGLQDLRPVEPYQDMFASNLFTLPRFRLHKQIPINPEWSKTMLKIDLEADEVTNLKKDLLSPTQRQYGSFAFNLGLTHPLSLRGGHFIEITPKLDTSLYSEEIGGQRGNTQETWIVPQLLLHWHWSGEHRTKQTTYTLEPIVNLRLMPAKKYKNLVSSQKRLMLNAYDILQLSLKNIMLDQINTGNSIQYGLQGSVFTSSSLQLDYILSRSHRFYIPIGNDDAPGLSIYRSNRAESSEFMAYGAIRANNFSVEESMWTDGKKIVRNELNIKGLFERWNLDVGYNYMNRNYYDIKGVDYSGEIDFDLWYNVHERWWIGVGARQKVSDYLEQPSSQIHTKSSPQISRNVGLRYKNDCLNFELTIVKNYLHFKNLEPSMAYILKVNIPMLG